MNIISFHGLLGSQTKFEEYIAGKALTLASSLKFMRIQGIESAVAGAKQKRQGLSRLNKDNAPLRRSELAFLLRVSQDLDAKMERMG